MAEAATVALMLSLFHDSQMHGPTDEGVAAVIFDRDSRFNDGLAVAVRGFHVTFPGGGRRDGAAVGHQASRSDRKRSCGSDSDVAARRCCHQ